LSLLLGGSGRAPLVSPVGGGGEGGGGGARVWGVLEMPSVVRQIGY